MFSSGREALGLLQKMEEFIEGIALSPEWQKRFAGYWRSGKPGNRQGPAGHDIVLMIRWVLALIEKAIGQARQRVLQGNAIRPQTGSCLRKRG